jgi:hypothetical protein
MDLLSNPEKVPIGRTDDGKCKVYVIEEKKGS